MEIDPTTLDRKSLYKYLTGSIVPRPIGWISTVDEAGNANLAPYSFFNAVNSDPPHVLFCPGIRAVDGAVKDSLSNVRDNGEFVVNIVTEATAEAMNLTATELPADVDEFAYAGLTKAPSVVVKAPRVGESPIHFECRVVQIVDLGDEPGGGSIVIGRVVHIHIDESVLLGTDKIDIAALQPIGRLAGTAYSRVKDTFDMVRRPPQVNSD